MPAKSAKQERFMQAVANNPKFAKEVGVPQSVGKEFTKAGGGTVQRPQMNKEMLNRKSDMKRKMSGRSGKSAEFETEKGRRMSEDMKRQMKMRAKTGDNAPMEPTEMKKGGMAKKGYKAGGKLDMVEKDGKKVPFYAADGKGKMASGGKVKKMMRGGPAGMYGESATEKQMKRKKSDDMMSDGMKKGGKVSEAKKEAKKAVKKHESTMHKGTKKMASGGKVRGAGMAKKGVRPCKMR